jgi:hypothetical protein
MIASDPIQGTKERLQPERLGDKSRVKKNPYW